MNYDFLDEKRVGMIGWSHGGMITLMNILCLSQILSATGTLTCNPNVRPRYSPEANGQAPEIHCGMGNQEQILPVLGNQNRHRSKHTNRGEDCYVQAVRRS